MTEYPVRLFASDAEIRRVGAGLLARTLPKSEWTHEAHLAACAWLLLERPDIVPETDLPDIIRNYNVAVGGVNDDSQGYHHTLTLLYIGGVRNFLGEERGAGLARIVNALLLSQIGDRNWPLTLYSRDRLFSVEARHGWLGPDRAEP
ncbi:hypothetical protein B0I00_0186 [Novosphingobium kunmingense]|uniref:Uncharacterized protein n=1 Tax=Novosphingobium kunmingense TaxID=1211806 RepID=A0A2N0I1E4_9SPHN|nr:hypothetical protein [Novosphingobium kunmingense]PKB25005.1 hypothetical protein B0I00_0186 [Novosphingobium kunmingense]